MKFVGSGREVQMLTTLVMFLPLFLWKYPLIQMEMDSLILWFSILLQTLVPEQDRVPQPTAKGKTKTLRQPKAETIRTVRRLRPIHHRSNATALGYALSRLARQPRDG